MDHISWSQLNMLVRCGEQYRRRYREGEIIPPSAALVRGSSCHKGTEKNYRQKVETKVDLPIGDVLDEYNDQWERRKYEIAWHEDELQGETPSKAEGKWKDSGVRLLQVYHRQQAPLVDPLLVEQKLEINFHGDFPKVVSIIDRITTDEVIEDDKFVSKTPSLTDAFDDVQLSIYDLAFRTNAGRPPKGLRKRFAVDLKKEPKTEVREAPPRDQATLDRLLLRLERAIEAIRKETFLPPQGGVWWCSPRFCGYWATCRVRP